MNNNFFLRLMIFLISAETMTSCLVRTETCEETLKTIREDDISLVLNDLQHVFGGYRVNYSGTIPENGMESRFRSNAELYVDLKDYVGKGDTLRKEKGTTSFFLYKKDSIHVFNYSCEGEFLKLKKESFARPIKFSDLSMEN